MDRIEKVREYVDNIILNIISPDERKNAYIHTYGVAQCCALIADKRGINSEIAYICGLLHDIYVYKIGSYLCHSQSGAEMARPALRDMNIFSEYEKTHILSAVYHHSNKELIHDEYDEVLKDADILQPFLNDAGKRIFYLAIPRLNYILDEFSITATPEKYGFTHKTSMPKADRRLALAIVTEELAVKNICGEKSDIEFMEIIKYYPESTAFNELTSAWCAAFIYHCCLKADIVLPIKQPPASCRFAGVGAWYEWGKDI